MDHRVVRRQDDKVGWVRVRYRVFFEGERENRRPVRAMLAAIDITTERNAQETIRQSEARIQQALHASRSFTFEWDPKTDEVRRSTSCAEILQLSGDDAVYDSGQNYFRRVMTEDRDKIIGVISKLTPTSSSYTIEYRVGTSDGRYVTLEETGQGSFDALGKLVRLVGVTTDITARQRIEAQLRESQWRQAFLLTLSDALRTLSDPATIQTEASRLLGEHLQVERAYYLEISESTGLAKVQREFRVGEMPSLVGEHRMAISVGAFLRCEAAKH